MRPIVRVQIDIQRIQVGGPDPIFGFDLRNAILNGFGRPTHRTHDAVFLLMPSQLLLDFHFDLFKKFHLAVVVWGFAFGAHSAVVT